MIAGLPRLTRASPLLMALLVSACGLPGPGPQNPSIPGAGQQTERTSLTIGIAQELPHLGNFAGAEQETGDLVNAGLVTRNAATFEDLPWLAESLPALGTDSWVVDPDGTMSTTYHLRSDVLWHDGTPFSSRDIAFGWEVTHDPQVNYQQREVAELITGNETPDDRTLTLHWSKTYPFADRVFRRHLLPLPRHLMEAPYRAGDYERFEALPYWTREFVGTGPFRVVDFQPGSVAELEAFDRYFLGRPKIDHVTVRVFMETTVALTNVLANNVDVTMRSALPLEGGLVAKAQWEARGEGAVYIVPAAFWWLNLSGTNLLFDDPRVRAGLLHAIDREAMSQSLTSGQEPVVDFPLSPRRPQFSRADAVASKYPYDVERARALLAQAGWTPGPDGVLVNASGARFAFEGRTVAGRLQIEQMQGATIDNWKAIGAEVTVNNLPLTVDRGEDFRNRWPGAYWASHDISPENWPSHFHTSNIPGPDNRWSRLNVSRWSNPEKDALLDDMNRTLNRAEWDGEVVDFIRLFTRDLPYLPLLYGSIVLTVRSGLTGIGPIYEAGEPNSRNWNAHEWEWRK